MIFSELLDITAETQRVRVFISGEDEIEGNAGALNNFLHEDVLKTNVLEIEAEDDTMRVWVGEVPI